MPNPVVHWQMLSKNPDASARFYTELFGWSVAAPDPLGYRRVDTGTSEGIQGGIWPSPPEAHSFVQLHVQVEDCDASVAKANELGATTIMPPQTLPQGERMAVLLDVEKVPFVILQPA